MTIVGKFRLMAKKSASSRTNARQKKAGKTVKHMAMFYSGPGRHPRELPAPFVASVKRLEKALKKNIFLFVHVGDGSRHPCHICPQIWREFVARKAELCRPNTAVLVDSFGGKAFAAYKIARLFQKQFGKFTAIIPRVAKSAATLMILGADKIIIGDDADLGPLDAQYFDFDTEEEVVSALNTVQAVERLEENANQQAINILEYLHRTTNKKYSLLIRHALRFAADITRPLFEKVDPRRYCREARVLAEAQQYAERLLRSKVSAKEAKAIAEALVTNYPTHDFSIERGEASRLAWVSDDEAGGRYPVGLDVCEPPNKNARKEIDWLGSNLDDIVAIGYVVEMPKEGAVS